MSRLLVLLVALLAACTSAVPPEKDRNDDPDLAGEYYALKRAGTEDIHASLAAARVQMKRMPRYSTVADAIQRPLAQRIAADAHSPAPLRPWKFLGPGNVGGRTRALVIDPADPNVMYAAGVSGGIWKTINAGARWEPIGDDLINIAVNSLVLHPHDRNVLYAGTGEGYFRETVRGTALPLRGNGIFVSRDAGATWEQLPSTANENFHWVNDLVISTHDPDRVYAATRTGVWRSPDGGATWDLILPGGVRGGCLDLAYRGDTGSDFLFASCGTFERATVYRSLNASGDPAWEGVLSHGQMGRTTLAIAPSQPSTVYAMSASNQPDARLNQALLAVWRSDRDGEPGSWTMLVSNDSGADPVGARMLTNLQSADNEVCGGPFEQHVTMGWYCNVIAVDPVDPNRVWAGGVDLFRSDDGGRTWGIASYWWAEEEPSLPYVHADQHAIVFHPRYDGVTNKTVYFGNDGGVFRTDDANARVVYGRDAVCLDDQAETTFVSLNNNYGVTQFYHGAVFPDGRRFIGGTQDNGSIVGSIDHGTDGWHRVTGGDGGYVAVDPVSPEFVYTESQFGFMNMSSNGGERFVRFREGLEGGDFLFVTPFTLDPNAPRTLWLGGRRMYRGAPNTVWVTASAPLPALVSAVAVAPGDSDRVIAGTSQGHIARTDSARTATASTVWTVVQPRGGFVSSLTHDPSNPMTVYATYAGFGGTHVWISRDGGATWSPLDGSGDAALPDIPVHSLAVDPTRPERLYLGTDLGVFVSLDGGASWAVENSGFAAAVTETVLIAPGSIGPAVYAFTHGRGAWRAELTPGQQRRRAIRH